MPSAIDDSTIDSLGSNIYTGCVFVDPSSLETMRNAVTKDLAPRYVVEDFIGRGAFATVWKVSDRAAGETLAVKRFDVARTQSGSFYREMSTLFKLQHERVVRIVNFLDSPSGTRHLFLEFCAGSSMRKAISLGRRAGAACPPERIRFLGSQLLQGLIAAHKLGLVHRDLKPENVLFDQPWSGQHYGGNSGIKLADFGLARALRDLSADSGNGKLPNISGSPAYMAPEQFTGSYYPASDLYAMGVMFYELLHGQLPFEGTPEDLGRKHLYEQPEFAADLPEPWPDLLRALLHKDPSQRPCGADVLARLQPPREALLPPPPPPAAVPAARETQSHAARPTLSTAPFSRCLGASAFQLLLHAGGSRGPDFVAATPEGIYRFAAGADLTPRLTDLPGLTAAHLAADGSLWLTQGSTIHRIAVGQTQPEAVLELMAPIRAIAPSIRPGAARVGVLSEGDLHECDPDQPAPLWSRTVRVGATPALARLADDRIVLAEGPEYPRLLLLDGAGEYLGELRLPGPCVRLGLWPGSAEQLYVLWDRAGELCLGRADLSAGQWQRLVEVRGLRHVAAPASGECVYGLCASGDAVRWRADGAAELVAGADDARPQADDFATDGRQFATLSRADGASWIHVRTWGG